MNTKRNLSVQGRAQDAFARLCSLYGEHNAQALMRVHGACEPRVALLARALGRSLAAVNAVREYRYLTSLRGGYRKLMTAARNDGNVKRVVEQAGRGTKFSPWEIDTAVAVVAAVLERR